MDLEVAAKLEPGAGPVLVPGSRPPDWRRFVIRAAVVAVLIALAWLWLWERDLRAKRETARVAQLRVLLASEAPEWLDRDPQLRRRAWREVREAYERHDGKLLWIDDGEPTESARELASALASAPDDGLVESDFGERDIQKGIEVARQVRFGENPAEAVRLAALDLRMTAEFLRYVRERHDGRLPSAVLDSDWLALRDTTDVPTLAKAIHSGPAIRTLLGKGRDDEPYRRLRQVLKRYHRLQSLGGWPTIASGPVLRVSDRDPRCFALRRRLARSGDVRDSSGGAVYDTNLVRAVRRFQLRHGLFPSGQLLPATLQALNVPVSERVRTIELNLERLRWMPQRLPDPLLRVNIPESQLRIVDQGADSLRMVAVVGSPSDPTPVFSDVLTYLEFHPTWGVPKRILEREMLPHFKRDKDYFEKHEMRVFYTAVEIPLEVDPRDVPWDSLTSDSFQYVVRQDAGPANPLGLIKFMCPNEYDVYLHDTPARKQFAFASRFLSHGCIRVQDPAALAAYLLRGSRLAAPESLQAILSDSVWRQVSLKRRMPVLVEYRTAWVDDDGTLQFRPDIYELDKRMDEALRSGQVSAFDINIGVARNPRMPVTAGWKAYRSRK